MYEFPVKNLTSQFPSATPISCNRGITLLSEYIFGMFGDFLVRMRRNNVNSASGLKKLPSPSCSATTISYKGTKIVAI